MSTYIDPTDPTVIMSARDYYVDRWSDVLDLCVPSARLWYPTPLPPLYLSGYLGSSRAEMVGNGWGNLPYDDDHRCYMLWACEAQYGVSSLLWSRTPAEEEDPIETVVADARLWRPLSSVLVDPGGEYPVGAGEVLRATLLSWALMPWATAVVQRQEEEEFVFAGSTWWVARWTVTYDDTVIASVNTVGEYDFANPPVAREIEDRPPMTGVGIVEIESDDLKKLAALIERLLSQKLTLSINNGRIIVQFPSGEAVEESRA